MRLVSLILLAVLSGALSGCFPVVAIGMGAGVVMSQDRRTGGAFVEDEGIELKALDRIAKQYPANVHAIVTSFNRNVLISGEVPSEAVKSEIGKLVYGIENVRNVNNELVIAGMSSVTQRSSDSLITSDVKLRFLKDHRFSAEHIKVVTESGTVFLMGIVKRAEAAASTEIASTTGGVMRVIKLFEYLD